MKGVQWILGALVFASEIMLWYGIGKIPYLLFRDKSSMLAWIAGIAAAAIVIVLWSLFFAPKAAHRLSLIPRIAVISAMALAAGLSLLKLGDKVSGWVLLTAVLLIQVFGQYMLNDRI